jgi:hypothetical protein
MAWHEFGHAWGCIKGRPLDHTNDEADAWENRMREQLYGPLGPNNAPRIAHWAEAMNMRRFPLAFLVLGVIFKTFLVVLWRHWHSGILLKLLIYYDPGARYFAEKVTHLLFDYGGSLSLREQVCPSM